MSKSSYPLKLPHSVKAAAERLAKADGVSLNQFIATAVAEKIGTLNTVDLFLEQRAGQQVPADMMPFLNNAPDVDPVVGDEHGDG
jgi:hypothetical protein